jgi:hypothetical protein
MKQLSRLLLATLLFALTISVAHASGFDVLLTPDKLNDSEVSLTVNVDRLKDGNLLFRVSIAPKAGRKFTANANTGLVVRKDYKDWGSQTRVRALPSEKDASTISCAFVVSEKSAQDPELYFDFQNVENFSGTVYRVSLKDLVEFYKP